jgi:hypothetical protein
MCPAGTFVKVCLSREGKGSDTDECKGAEGVEKERAERVRWIIVTHIHIVSTVDRTILLTVNSSMNFSQKKIIIKKSPRRILVL